MAHDLVIRGGSLVDGTGSEPFTGDVAVDGRTIAKVGKVEGAGHREIDAEGHIVTPGFVDLHTHFDAQAGWDPLLTPVSWHGVTTALFGNCGVTFAPCKPADREFLAGMMETVEDIPRNAILTGLPWDWESYGEYLDSIEKLGPAITSTQPQPHQKQKQKAKGARRGRGSHRGRDRADRRTHRPFRRGGRHRLLHQPPARSRAAGRTVDSGNVRQGSRTDRHLGGGGQGRRHPAERPELRQPGRRDGHADEAGPGRRDATVVQRAACPGVERQRQRLRRRHRRHARGGPRRQRSDPARSGGVPVRLSCRKAWPPLRLLFQRAWAEVASKKLRTCAVDGRDSRRDTRATGQASRRSRRSLGSKRAHARPSGSATTTVLPIRAVPRRASTAWPRPRACIRWRCGWTRCWSRTAGRCSTSASSIRIWRA